MSAGGTTSASMRYDPLGRLYETDGGSSGITRFLYDGDELVAEYDGSGTLLQVTDAARQEGLNAGQRRELGQAVEAESRQGGANLGYRDIREIDRAIQSGNY